MGVGLCIVEGVCERILKHHLGVSPLNYIKNPKIVLFCSSYGVKNSLLL